MESELHGIRDAMLIRQGVLAASTRQEVMGQLVDYTVSLMASDILALPDITELESSRIGELCKLVHPLDQLFMNPAAEVCHRMICTRLIEAEE